MIWYFFIEGNFKIKLEIYNKNHLKATTKDNFTEVLNFLVYVLLETDLICFEHKRRLMLRSTRTMQLLEIVYVFLILKVKT